MQFINLCLIHVSTVIIIMCMENRQGHRFHIKTCMNRFIKFKSLTNMNIQLKGMKQEGPAPKPNAVGRPFPCFFPKNGLTYLISDGGSP